MDFSEWAKIQLAEKAAKKKQECPSGDLAELRAMGYRRSFDMCKYHGIDLTLVSRAVAAGKIKGFEMGNQLWIDRDEFRDFFGIY